MKICVTQNISNVIKLDLQYAVGRGKAIQ